MILNTVTGSQQKSLILGSAIIILVILLDLLLPNTNYDGKIILWSIASIIFSVLISYSFIIKTSYSMGPYYPSPGFRRRKSTFKPRIIPPPAQKKKTLFRGNCEFCSKATSFGFTCSFCNGYYCDDHRIPEKHNCSGLYQR